MDVGGCYMYFRCGDLWVWCVSWMTGLVVNVYKWWVLVEFVGCDGVMA